MPNCQMQRLADQRPMSAGRRCPANHTSWIQIKYGCHIKPALSCPYVGDIRHRGAIGLLQIDLAVQHIRKCWRTQAGCRGDDEAALPDRPQLCLAHQSAHPMATNHNTLSAQCMRDASAAASPATGAKGCRYLSLLAQGPRPYPPSALGVVAGAANAQHPADVADVTGLPLQMHHSGKSSRELAGKEGGGSYK